jgi:MFS family permease
VYQQAWHFPAATLTAVFAVYAVALLSALLVTGRLSDHIGRRPVIIAALVAECAGMGCFIAARSVLLLYLARFSRAWLPARPPVQSAPRSSNSSRLTGRSSGPW